MSFYHILPSNVAPETYPNNTAASYTTALGNPYNLSGKWEVGITNISYSGCLKTFVKDDRIIVTEEIKDVDSILLAKTPFYINFDGRMLTSEMISFMKCEDDIRRPVKVRCNEGMEMVSQMDIQEVTGFVSYLQCEVRKIQRGLKICFHTYQKALQRFPQH